MTGREEADKRYENKVEKKLKGQPVPVVGFYYSMNDVSIRTVNVYLTSIIKFLDTVQKPVEEIQRIDIDKYFRSMNTISKAYRKQVYAALKKFFTYCSDAGYIESNVFEGVQKVKGSDKRNKDVLTQEECIEFLNNARNSTSVCAPRNNCMLLIFITTGIRLSALREMNVEDVNFNESSVFIRTKRDKSATLKLSPKIMDEIRNYLSWRDKYAKDTNALFVSTQGQRICPMAINNMIKDIAKGVTDKHITAHRLRATFATTVYEETHDIKLLQSLLIHERPETTYLYIDDKRDKSREASELVLNVLNL